MWMRFLTRVIEVMNSVAHLLVGDMVKKTRCSEIRKVEIGCTSRALFLLSFVFFEHIILSVLSCVLKHRIILTVWLTYFDRKLEVE